MLIAFESESGHSMRKFSSWIAAEKKYIFRQKSDVSLPDRTISSWNFA